MSDGPYRKHVTFVDRDNQIWFGPIFRADADGHRRIERYWSMDGFGKERMGIWDGQKAHLGGSIAVKMCLVATREQWDAYKKAVDELWEEWSKDETP